MALSPATSYTPALNDTAQALLGRNFKPGFRYWKAGVLLEGLLPESKVQPDLFRPATGHEKPLMAALDAVNTRFGRGALRLLGQGIPQLWGMTREKLSPRFTTAWDELVRVRA